MYVQPQPAEVEEDEYIVDYIFARRDIPYRGDGPPGREYRVKWRGYPKSQSTWEPAEELNRRPATAEIVNEFEERMRASEQRSQAESPAPAPAKRGRGRPRKTAPPVSPPPHSNTDRAHPSSVHSGPPTSHPNEGSTAVAKPG